MFLITKLEQANSFLWSVSVCENFAVLLHYSYACLWLMTIY